MAYDNTNFYGDLIVSEYDDKGNFMTPPTPTGYYVYHILGDGFDLMSEMCTQFMNDFSILTASSKSLDNFWGVSYNMPRPSLSIPYSLIFSDDGVRESKNSNWYVRTSDTSLTVTVDDDGTNLSNSSTTTSVYYFANPEHSTSQSPPITIGDFVIECDVISTNFGRGSQIAFLLQGLTNNFNLSSYTAPYHLKMEKVGTTVKQYINDTLIRTTTISDRTNYYMGFQLYKTCSIKFKNYRIYDTSTPSKRPLTDDEYKIYLYLRNCRLMTREDIEINMNKCFAVEKENSQYYIFFSTETNYLSTVNHLNYNSKTTEESNLAKNDEDTSLNFITNFASDEDTLLIESGLSEVEEVIEVINVPSPNGYDPAFLELLENYISVKGNLKIKEYSI